MQVEQEQTSSYDRVREILSRLDAATLDELKSLRKELQSLARDLKRSGEPDEVGYLLASATAALESKAWTALRSSGGEPGDLFELAEALKDLSRFGFARRIYQRARENPEKRVIPPERKIKLIQRHALCTYKDPDRPSHKALEDALSILQRDANLDATRDQETLGLAGAIYKRKWQLGGAKQDLERSLAYYLRGLAQGVEGDQGYTGINAAYILDLLANIEEELARETHSESESAQRRRQGARAIRQQLIDELPLLTTREDYQWLQNGWWFAATMAEACFGNGLYDEAAKWLAESDRIVPPDWEFESTARQLSSLAGLQRDRSEEDRQRGWEVLQTFLGGDAEAVASVIHGNVGLALSGGGFRASLFHIGVLAKLAELDILRHVHVLSCVSGGSIVGAYYYLALRKLLQEKPDAEIDRDDYLRIVHEMAENFLSGVQKNLRTRLVGSVVANWKMVFSSTYSRTQRMGELFEKHLYSRKAIGDGGERKLKDLFIRPAGREFFQPKRENWRRKNKVPMLVLNATTLNTGHNFQFTASFMGESPFGIDEEIDGNWRLRRMYHGRAPAAYRDVSLGTAVAASACVPGLFEPIAMPKLYENPPEAGRRLTVRLVDGGVHDNQGVATLLEQDCSVLLVSDASGQMGSEPDPKGGILAPLLRTNSALMERVRQAQFQDLKTRQRSSLLDDLMIVHLKKALEVEPIDWIGCEEPPDAQTAEQKELLPYTILRDCQKSLAGVRTDLDSFSDIEALALMTSGYLMTEKYGKELKVLPRESHPRDDWDFMHLATPLSTSGDTPQSERLQRKVRRHLRVAADRAFKIWRLWTPLRVLSWALGVAALAGFVWACLSAGDTVLLTALPGSQKGFTLTLSDVGWFVGAVALTLLVGKLVVDALQWQQTLRRVAVGLGMGVVGAGVAWLHIGVFDRLFLLRGRLKGSARRSGDGTGDPERAETS